MSMSGRPQPVRRDPLAAEATALPLKLAPVEGTEDVSEIGSYIKRDTYN